MFNLEVKTWNVLRKARRIAGAPLPLKHLAMRGLHACWLLLGHPVDFAGPVVLGGLRGPL